MKRRQALKLIGSAALAAGALPSALARAFFDGSDLTRDQFILIGQKNSALLGRFIEDMHPLIAKRSPLWLADLTVLDPISDRNKIQEFIRRYGPNTTSLPDLMLFRIPSNTLASFDTMDVETWTPDWFAHQQQKRITDACYPVSNGWWSVEGDFHPTAKQVRTHIIESPNHTDGKFSLEWLQELQFEELQSLHSDHHREMIAEGEVKWDHVNQQCPPQ